MLEELSRCSSSFEERATISLFEEGALSFAVGVALPLRS